MSLAFPQGSRHACVATPRVSRLLSLVLALLILSPVPSQARIPSVDVRLNTSKPYAGVPIVGSLFYSGADSLWLEPAAGGMTFPWSGHASFWVSVRDTTVLYAYARNRSGTAVDSLLIEPFPPDEPELSIIPSSAPPGATVRLRVTAFGASQLRIDPGIGQVPVSGTYYNGEYEARIDSVTTFTVTATNPMGSASVSETVEVSPPTVDRWEAQPVEIVVGETTELEWKLYFADSLHVRGLEAELSLADPPVQGSLTVQPAVSQDYILEATNIGGLRADTLHVDVLPVLIEEFTVHPSEVFAGDEATLAWSVAGEGQVSLDGLGDFGPADSLVVRPEATSVYTLRVVAGGYETTRSVTVDVSDSPPRYLALSWATDEVPGTPPQIVVGEPFDVYVLALSPPHGIFAYEFGLKIPPGFQMIDSQIFPESATVSVAEQPSWVVGTGECMGENEDHVPLLRVTLQSATELALQESSLLQIVGAEPSTFSGAPGYYCCRRELHPFLIAEPLSLSDLQSGVPVVSFGLGLEPVEGGVRVGWDLSPALAPHALEIQRAEAGAAWRVLTRLEGEDAVAQGSWIDRDAAPAGTRWVVRAELGGSWFRSEEVAYAPPSVAGRSRILRNVPNPFNPSTEIVFVLAESGSVDVEIFDAAGRRVRRIRAEARPAGENSLVWDGRDHAGRSVASGVYIVRLRATDAQDQRRVLLLK